MTDMTPNFKFLRRKAAVMMSKPLSRITSTDMYIVTSALEAALYYIDHAETAPPPLQRTMHQQRAIDDLSALEYRAKTSK